MSYTKQTWNTGDVITAQKLNHMEDGIESVGGLFVVHITQNDGGEYVADKTYAEIEAVYDSANDVIMAVYDGSPYLLDGFSKFNHTASFCTLCGIDGNTLYQSYFVIMSDGSISEGQKQYPEGES